MRGSSHNDNDLLICVILSDTRSLPYCKVEKKTAALDVRRRLDLSMVKTQKSTSETLEDIPVML